MNEESGLGVPNPRVGLKVNHRSVGLGSPARRTRRDPGGRVAD